MKPVDILMLASKFAHTERQWMHGGEIVLTVITPEERDIVVDALKALDSAVLAAIP